MLVGYLRAKREHDMPIKQIQLRGISRTPSDRMTADGGCAESLNVHLDQNETAPTLPPDDVTSDKLGTTSFQGDTVYIHKTSNYEHYIALGADAKIDAFWKTGNNYEHQEDIVSVGSGNTITSASHIGNTLILLTSDGKRHFLVFKGGSYTYLGTRFPEPKVQFRTYRPAASTTSEQEVCVSSDQDMSLIYNFNHDAWSSILAAEQSGNPLSEGQQERLSEVYDINSKLWALFDSIRNGNRNNGLFTLPTLGRFALRMYDGEYIYVSAPVYLGAGVGTTIRALASHREVQITGGTEWRSYVKVFTYPYQVKAILSNWSIGNWGDYIESIDLFLSPYFSNPNVGSRFSGLGYDNYFGFFDDEGWESKIIGSSNFYKVASFDKNHISSLEGSGYDILYGHSELEKLDVLVEQEELNADSIPEVVPLGLKAYNDRAIIVGGKQVLPSGYSGFFAPMAGPSTQSAGTDGVSSFKIKYYIVGEDGSEHTVMGRAPSGGTSIQSYSLIVSSSYYYALPFTVLFYPDANCVRAEIEVNNSSHYELPMKAHPRLNCAYFIHDPGIKITQENTASGLFTTTESNNVVFKNKLYLTEVSNPFLLSLGSTIKFADAIVDVSFTTKALSEGQYGQYPIVVFTEGGIETVEMSSVGDFLHTHALSREVALPGTILQIDQANVFTTEAGVRLLQGSEVVDLSPNMNGRHYQNMTELATKLATTQWADIVTAANDSAPFMAFMRTAKPAYDYTGRRIIWFRDDKAYQYVYMLQTQTWHKLVMTAPTYGHYIILNSTTECLVSASNQTIHDFDILDYSTVLSDASLLSDEADSELGFIVTRPFDLGEPDVRKSINRVRIRGSFNRKDVRYLLLGSFDGVNWALLDSLHGGSYRLFRLVILTNLTPTERISWVDIEYDSRFNKKLR